MRNNHDCKVVDSYKARKRYTVTESLDLIVSAKIKKPNKNFLKLKCPPKNIANTSTTIRKILVRKIIF